MSMSRSITLATVVFVGLCLNCRDRHHSQPGEEVVELNWKDPNAWKQDGMWEITRCPEGIKFHKDEKAAHNSMCWMKLDKPLKKGQTVEVTYQMEVPFKHVDVFMGDNCEYPPRDQWKKIYEDGGMMPEFAEVFSLGNRPQTTWLTLRRTITSDDEINTLGFLSWGWRWAWRDLAMDVNTWMKVKEMKVLPPDEDPDWFEWVLPEPINTRKIPKRSAIQDFFPFGVYISLGSMTRVAQREGKGLWELMDEILADLAERGLNFTTIVNMSKDNLEKMAKMHEKYGLKMNPACGQFDLKHVKFERIKESFKEAVLKFRDSDVIAGWGCGEEFPPARMKVLKPAHDFIHQWDPDNTVVNVHNWMPDYHIAGELLDIRIAIRDIYPWHGIPHIGAATPESSIYYYEDDIDRCQQLLPQGASLWVCAQGQGEGGPVGKGGHYKTPTVVQIRLQTWAALGHGAQGFEFFVYHSQGTPERAAFDGLRAFDGSATDRLVELGKLAKKLTPLGSIIAKWRKYRVPTETNNRDIRAYMFASPEDDLYMVVYNRSAERASVGKVRVPFTVGGHVKDLVNFTKLSVITSGGKSMFSVSLSAGSGSIISLGRKVPEDI